MNKQQATMITGGLTATSKMPCKSYSLPTIACRTGYKMAQVKGSICSQCYANKGFYSMYANTIEPAQHARLESISDPMWIDAMVTLIGSDQFFRWHDSGDIQSVDHLAKIAQICELTPNTKHWLPTREYGIVREYTAKHKLPKNLIIRLSAMFADQPVKVPASLQGVEGVAVSNVHAKSNAIGSECNAPKQSGKCLDCRACWDRSVNTVSYKIH
jgi:hypothetical protein